jgi:exonuclease SbcD
VAGADRRRRSKKGSLPMSETGKTPGQIPAGFGPVSSSPGTGSVAGNVAAAGRWEPFRFLHASDLLLHRPLQGVAEYPPSWQSVLASATYHSAIRFFDAAIAERVSFVLLSGNVVDLDFGGPRAIAFLLSQFERLGQRGIDVYWCGGQQDHLERWPTAIELPPNVRLFPSTLVDTATVRRQGKTLATIYGAAFDPHRTSVKEFQAGANVGFPIGFTHGSYESQRLAGHGIRYWALGGKLNRDVITQPGQIVAYPGTHLGRDSAAQGARGAILVSVEADGQVRTQTVDCDSVRWLNLSLSVAESVHIDALKDLLADRALQMTSKLPDQHLLVDWHIATTGDYSAEFRREENHGKLLKWLRHEFSSSPGLWSVSLTFSAPQNLPKGWQNEDTILGDYLREVARYRQDLKLPFHLAHYAGGQDEIDGVTRLTRMDAAVRESVLDAALLAGIERLGGNQT